MLDEKREYTLYSKYTGDTLGTFGSRKEANAERNISERDGDYSTRIRTTVTQVERYPVQPVSTESRVNHNEPIS
jgi:hypothetical protein